MNRQIVDIVRIVRRMKGGSQAHLVEGHDHRFYVAKFVGNPQGTCTLVNEWLATHLIRQFGITTPDQVVLRLGDMSQYATAPSFQIGDRSVPISSGLHLGSLCPVDPEKEAIYDFLPNRLVYKTVNLGEFAKMLVLDTFFGQADSRQAVFVRDGSRRELSFRAHFIDHGLIFGGKKWKIEDLVSPSLYFDQKIYLMIDTTNICAEAIEILARVSEEDLHTAARDIPSEWLAPIDYNCLHSLFTKALKRRDRIPALISERLAFPAAVGL